MSDTPLLQRARLIEHELNDALKAAQLLVKELDRPKPDALPAHQHFLQLVNAATSVFHDLGAMVDSMVALTQEADRQAQHITERCIHV